MIIDRVEVSESFYKELLNMSELNKKSANYNELFQGIKVVLNKDIKQGYKIYYK